MKNRDSVVALLLLVFCFAFAWQTTGIKIIPSQANAPITARTLPYLLAATGALLSFLQLLISVFGKRDKASADSSQRTLDWRRAGAFMLVAFSYVAILDVVGFVVSSVAFLCTSSIILGERRPLLLLAVYIPIVLVFWLVFSQLFGLF